MNSDPDNLPDLTNHEDLNSSDLERIENLIEFLIQGETSSPDVDASPQIPLPEETLASTNDNLGKDFDFLEQSNFDDGEFAPQSEEEDIKVEIQSEHKLTLAEAAEYEAFLRQTVKSTGSSAMENINTVEQLEAIDTKNADPEDLADAVNSLIPLIVRLLEFKLDNSRESIIQTIRPILDRLIKERTAEDSPKMASAIARILPAAIEDEIKLNPQAIAKALAPEIALSLREQIRLDKNAIPQTLGPEMGKAIKAQIESEKDAMVDALYPVIGSTISKYMVEVVQDINSKVESTLSPEGVKRKFRAKMQGVSEAELIFKESVGYHVRAIFLIDKDSGLVIQEIQVPGEKQLDSDMLAGMLTAIRSFANDCITSGSELDLVDYGDWQIPIEVAGYCYLAVIVAGEPPKEFIQKIRRVLGEIVLEHDQAIKDFQGDLEDVPLGIKNKLEQLTEENKDQPQKSSPPFLLWLLMFILGLVFIPWGIVRYRTQVTQNIEQSIAMELDAAPELSIYRLEPTVKGGKLIVQGRVPSMYLRDRATTAIQEIADQNKLEIENQIIAVNVPVNPEQVAGEAQRLTNLFNQQPKVSIETDYRAKVLTVTGYVLDKATRQTINQGFTQIPGVEQVILQLDEELPIVKQRIYFNLGSRELDFADNWSKINAVQELLQQHPQLHLKLSVHSDRIGSDIINQQLSQERCQVVKAAFVARGIESSRLVDSCGLLSLAENNDNNQATWLKRYVSFEPFIP